MQDDDDDDLVFYNRLNIKSYWDGRETKNGSVKWKQKCHVVISWILPPAWL